MRRVAALWFALAAATVGCDGGSDDETDSDVNLEDAFDDARDTPGADGDDVAPDGTDGDDVAPDGTDAADVPECTMPEECDDLEPCNGIEDCAGGACVAGTPLDSGTPCDLDGEMGACRSGTCTPTSCGNGMVEPGEECDDGNTVDTDACPNSCIAASCGDGVAWDGVEACDDGNTVDTDACLSSCIAASCGDRVVWDGVETCDDGNTSTEACAYGLASCSVCDATCQNAPGATAFCGDGLVNGPETCDDGNTSTEACAYGLASCSVCDATCQNAPGATAFCGDGLVNGPETCDDGNTFTEACAYGLASCTVCDATCQNAAGATARCGDGLVNGPETCDAGSTSLMGCRSCQTVVGWYCNGTPTTPTTSCTTRCGDGIIAGGAVGGSEMCDDGGTGAGGDGCNSACQMETGFTCWGIGASPPSDPGATSVCYWFLSNPGAVTIPDLATATLDATMPVGCAIGGFRMVSVAIYHTWVGDLRVELRAPSGATAALFDRPGVPATAAGNPADLGTSTSRALLYFSEDLGTPATLPIIPETVPPSVISGGTYAIAGADGTRSSFSSLLSGSAAGTWSIVASDLNAGDTGSMANMNVAVVCQPN
jgi:cysteine-rich repeat protein